MSSLSRKRSGEGVDPCLERCQSVLRASTLWSSFLYRSVISPAANNMTQIYLARMLLLLVVCLGVALGQEVTDEVIDNINEATGLALK